MKKTIDMNLVQLKAENIELKTEIKSLEAQVEKMKCCQNCKHFDKLYNRCEKIQLTLKSALCTSLDKWELRR